MHEEAPAGAPTGAPPHARSIVAEPRSLRYAIGPDVLADLADALGVPRGEADGAWRCPSPDHDDEHASAGVFPATLIDPRGHGRWKCQACGRGGDAIDLVRVVLGLDFAAALDWLAEWLTGHNGLGKPQDSWDPVDLGPGLRKPRFPVDRVEATLAGDPVPLLGEFLADKGIEAAPEDVARWWRIGVEHERSLIFPYFNRHGDVYAAKARRPRDRLIDGEVRRVGWTPPIALPGSGFTGALYGSWRDRGCQWAVVVEGESDAIAVADWLRDRAVDVLALPGAGIRPSPTRHRLVGRSIVLILDADAAGEAARSRWRDALAPHASVYDARLPDGLDAVDAGRQAVLRAISQAVR